VRIRLFQSGGLIGKTMSASTDWPFTANEWKELVHTIEKKKTDARLRDAFSYFIQSDDQGKKLPVSIQNIPPRFMPLFTTLFEQMKVEE
jgi:hypothetical protein